MSILDMLEDKRVVGFKLDLNNTVLEILEQCDCNFRYDLDGEEVDQLIFELQKLRDQMPTPRAKVVS